MIEPDREIPGGQELLARRRHQADPQLGAGESRGRDQPLQRLHPGDVCVAKDGDAIRSQRDHPGDGAREGLLGLLGQPVAEVEIDPLEPDFAGGLIGAHGDLGALVPADGALDAVVEILKAKAEPAHTEAAVADQLVAIGGAWVRLQGDRGRVVEGKDVAQRNEEALEIVGLDEGRASPTEVKLADGAASPEGPGHRP